MVKFKEGERTEKQLARPLKEYPKVDYGLRSKGKKIGVGKLRGKKIQKKILVLGTGRSGTTHMAKVLTAAGLKVKREQMGADGTASLYFFADSEWHPWWDGYAALCHKHERRSDYEFEHILHVIRDPLKTIPSMAKMFQGLVYDYMEHHSVLPKGIRNKMLRCMYIYKNVNELCASYADRTFRIEDLRYEWPEVSTRLGISPTFPNLPPANKSSGYKKSEPVTWEDLEQISPELTAEIKTLAARYGYV